MSDMKRSVILAAIVAISSLATTPVVMAAPSFIPIDFTCPSAVGSGPHVLSRFGSTISGYGQEVVDGSPAFNSPHFVYYVSSPNIPAKLTSYYNDGTDFDSINSVVSCMYTSSGGYDSFVATYAMTNGYGGQIVSSTSNTISLNQLVGLKG